MKNIEDINRESVKKILAKKKIPEDNVLELNPNQFCKKGGVPPLIVKLT